MYYVIYVDIKWIMIMLKCLIMCKNMEKLLAFLKYKGIALLSDVIGYTLYSKDDHWIMKMW